MKNRSFSQSPGKRTVSTTPTIFRWTRKFPLSAHDLARYRDRFCETVAQRSIEPLIS